MADKDKLTGLLTDDYLLKEIDFEFQRAGRFNREIAFILLDFVFDDPENSGLKYTVLRTLAKCTESKIRDIDVAVRWGHQILLLLPETPRDGAEIVAGKIREAFFASPIRHPEFNHEIPVALRTVVLIYPHDGADKETILYNLKENIQSAARLGPAQAPQ